MGKVIFVDVRHCREPGKVREAVEAVVREMCVTEPDTILEFSAPQETMPRADACLIVRVSGVRLKGGNAAGTQREAFVRCVAKVCQAATNPPRRVVVQLVDPIIEAEFVTS